MAITVDCGEGKHKLCSGRGHTAYLFPQESIPLDKPAFHCGCWCHHDGTGVPCQFCESGTGESDSVPLAPEASALPMS